MLLNDKNLISFSCLDQTNMFPPGRSIWCNKRNGPTARPIAQIGGHACCGNADMCNKQLKPKILDYRRYPVKEYNKGGLYTYQIIFLCLENCCICFSFLNKTFFLPD